MFPNQLLLAYILDIVQTQRGVAGGLRMKVNGREKAFLLFRPLRLAPDEKLMRATSRRPSSGWLAGVNDDGRLSAPACTLHIGYA